MLIESIFYLTIPYFIVYNNFVVKKESDLYPPDCKVAIGKKPIDINDGFLGGLYPSF